MSQKYMMQQSTVFIDEYYVLHEEDITEQRTNRKYKLYTQTNTGEDKEMFPVE